MTAASELLGYFTGFQLYGRTQFMQDSAFSNARVAGKGNRLTADKVPKFFDSLSCDGTGTGDRISGLEVDLGKSVGWLQIGFIYA
jgi:hypothetical protein